ncbi:MAG: mycothiol synthase [Rothia sp. (in: high G+C Gram-positive bacteria)]|nr:mycothiol synthase [Rothia sp. (in: high G+C Gram-positive bacteria)]
MKNNFPESKISSSSVISREDLADLVSMSRELTVCEGSSPFSEQTLLSLHQQLDQTDRAYRLVLARQRGQLLGAFVAFYPRGTEAGLIEGALYPRWRGQGLGSQLLKQLVEQLRSQQAGRYGAWVHEVKGDQAQLINQRATHLASKYGFSRVRELHKMQFCLTPERREKLLATGRAQQAAAGLSLTTFTPGQDNASWLASNAAAFANHPEQGGLTEADLQERLNADWFDPQGFFLLKDPSGQLAGYCWTKVVPQEPTLGEIYVVGVDPNWQGQGLGRFLMLTGMAHLASLEPAGEPLENMLLYVDAENQAAFRLYTSLGWSSVTIDRMYKGVLD